MAMLRVVLDTNVVISVACWPASRPAKAFRYLLEEGRILLSPEVFVEDKRLLLPKFDRYLALERRLLFVEGLRREGDMIAVTEQVVACRDLMTTSSSLSRFPGGRT